MQEQIRQEYEHWLRHTTGALHEELASIAQDEVKIEDAFYTHLAFGTGGLRGVLGAGTNRMNVHTIARASKGYADYLNNSKTGGSVVISYDSRNFSDVFARVTATVFAQNGIKAYLFRTLMPTPVCSYAVRALKADAGVMVTASHNPKQYNGYKAYGPDGCQITNEVADGVLACINAVTDYFSVGIGDFDALLAEGKIVYIDDSVYQGFLAAVEKLSVLDNGVKNTKIVYSPLNGTGNIPVRDILARRGFDKVTVVPEQEYPDGNFTTCPYPNPEIKEALALAIALGEKTDADLVLATDPDCDRVGIAVRKEKGGEFVLISGNEVGILLTDYLFRERHELGTLPADPVIVRTIVTTDMVDDIAHEYGADVRVTLTGFKYIGEVITDLAEVGQADRYVLGFEESYGYMSGEHVRDKDAVNASMLIAEMCEYYAREGKTLYETLMGIYQKYGYFKSFQKSIAFEGAAGVREMNEKLTALRANPPAKIASYDVRGIKDYKQGIDGLPKSDVLMYALDGIKVFARPSGTEPKLKIYLLARAKSFAELDALYAEIMPFMEGLFR